MQWIICCCQLSSLAVSPPQSVTSKFVCSSLAITTLPTTQRQAHSQNDSDIPLFCQIESHPLFLVAVPVVILLLRIVNSTSAGSTSYIHLRVPNERRTSRIKQEVRQRGEDSLTYRDFKYCYLRILRRLKKARCNQGHEYEREEVTSHEFLAVI